MALAYLILGTYGCKYTLRTCNTYFVSTVTVVVRTRLGITSHVNCCVATTVFSVATTVFSVATTVFSVATTQWFVRTVLVFPQTQYPFFPSHCLRPCRCLNTALLFVLCWFVLQRNLRMAWQLLGTEKRKRHEADWANHVPRQLRSTLEMPHRISLPPVYMTLATCPTVATALSITKPVPSGEIARQSARL
jgi:hypothetical protein